ncbi:hypothetical protein F2P56_026607 [Juglans regia]|uniref:Uncharacterized protein LOC108998250 n=2 Tax=Juglans regia TaxID=51240 RepID=A0A2I4FF68_JUGRE|nr:uncharacterized protein LOC108998250 [Juglans regia]KAF5451502.1 hypothetical protein F2P56_026607 [Juglans regia]
MTMTFTNDKSSVTLRGLSSSKTEFVEDVQICQLTIMERKGMLLQIVAKETNQEVGTYAADIEAVLAKYDNVFAEPKGLPPRRTKDHQITLKEGTMPISTRPYRKFVKGYGSIAAPLTNLLKKDAFNWREEATKALADLKKAVTNPPVLALPDFSKPFLLECDASGKRIGVVLSQEGRPLALLSQALKGKALDLSTYENEFLAIVLDVKKLRPYLLGAEFHGKDNVAADSLSRREEVEEGVAEMLAITVLDPLWLEQLRHSYLNDEEISAICKKLQEGKLSDKKFEVRNRLLFKKGRLFLSSSSPMKDQVL